MHRFEKLAPVLLAAVGLAMIGVAALDYLASGVAITHQLLIAMQKLASHCLLERDDCTSGPADRVNSRRSNAAPHDDLRELRSQRALDWMSRHRCGT